MTLHNLPARPQCPLRLRAGGPHHQGPPMTTSSVLHSSVDDLTVIADLRTDPDLGQVVHLDIDNPVSDWPGGGPVHGAGQIGLDEAEALARHLLVLVELGRMGGRQ